MLIWDIAAVLCKLLILASVAMQIGGLACFVLIRRTLLNNLNWLLRYMYLGSVLGIVSTSLFFLVQIGAINQAGLLGMFDPLMGSILAQTGLAYASALRLFGFVLIFSCAQSIMAEDQNVVVSPVLKYILFTLSCLSIFSIGYSFTLIGHVSNQSVVVALAVVVHVLVMGFWLGSLYPLWKLCSLLSVQKLMSIMHQFGQVAMALVALLIVSGVFMLTRLLETFSELFTTPYGLSLVAKLCAVMLLLLIAARNKFTLVPSLGHSFMVSKLKDSICMEMALGGSILALTAFFTTVVGVGHE